MCISSPYGASPLIPPFHFSSSSMSARLVFLCFIGTSHQLPILYMVVYIWGFPGGSTGKECACNAGDPSLIPGSGRSSGGGNSYPLHYSCLENSTDRGAWQTTVLGVTKSQTQLGNWLSVHVCQPNLPVFPALPLPSTHLFSVSASLKSNLNRAHKFFMSLACLPL